MKNIQDIEDKIFFECKNVLENLSKINSVEELLLKQDLFYEVSERIAFLKILEKNKDNLVSFEAVQYIDNQNMKNNFDNSESKDFGREMTQQNIEEEVLFNDHLNEIQGDNEITEEIVETEMLEDEPRPNEFVSEKEEPKTFESEIQDSSDEIINEELGFSQETEAEILQTEPSVLESISNVADESVEVESLPETSESRRTIVEFEPENHDHHDQESQYFDNEISAKSELHDKKFKLARLKGLKSVQSLFDDDPLEQSITQTPQKDIPKNDPGSLLKANVPTDFMEAEKRRPEFRLDLNDKISFAQNLFGGSQADLNETIAKLNEFKTLDDAKEYLSDIYYAKNWKKADEYAQRLWTLVENKFL